MQPHRLIARVLPAAALFAAGLAQSGALMAQAVAPSPAAPATAPAPAAQSRPNVLMWVLDDVGFAQLSSFGGIVPTPNIDRVAAMGLRYTNYHTPPVCSAARASILTGRNSHSVHIGGHTALARDYPGYDGLIPAGAGTVAENFRQAGYATFALGKWDHLPPGEMTPAGPYTHWPLRQGFDRFYGFLSAETNQFEPLLWNGNVPVNRPVGPSYHLSADLADQAIAMIEARNSSDPAPPFFLYWATGAAHAPHHAPAEWIAKFRGRFDAGWDKARETILKAQKAQGLVPRNARLAPRPAVVPVWDSLSSDEKRLYARQMEVFAAALAYADAQFGRMLDALERRGELENTMIVIVSDNGASGEGGPTGTYHELLFATGSLPTAAQNVPFMERWGGPTTYPHYALGWAVAGNTPYRNYKQTTYEGGTRTPLIVAWPRGIAAHGQVRDQFIHSSDIAPTLLAAAGVAPAATVNNAPQLPFEGRDFRYSFTTTAPAPSRSQYFEMFGHRGLWSDGWKLVAPSKMETWVMNGPGRTDGPWELYNLSTDPGEARNLAASDPARVARLDGEFQAQARRYNVYPLASQGDLGREIAPKMMADFARRHWTWRYPDAVHRVAFNNAPPIGMRPFTMRAEVTLPNGLETGPVFAHGGANGGFALYLDKGRPVVALRTMAGELRTLTASGTLAAGHNDIELSLSPANPADRANPERVITVKAGGQALLIERGVFPIATGETFDIGRDDGSAVADAYPGGAQLPGLVRNTVFTFP